MSRRPFVFSSHAIDRAIQRFFHGWPRHRVIEKLAEISHKAKLVRTAPGTSYWKVDGWEMYLVVHYQQSRNTERWGTGKLAVVSTVLYSQWQEPD